MVGTTISASCTSSLSSRSWDPSVATPTDCAFALIRYQNGFDDSEVDVDLVAQLVEFICRTERPGAILIFMPGMNEINQAQSAIEALAVGHPIRVFPLHSSCTQQEQRAIFKRVPPGTRKVVISTNIAESSITIDDVVFVVDSSKHKEMACVLPPVRPASAYRSAMFSQVDRMSYLKRGVPGLTSVSLSAATMR